MITIGLGVVAFIALLLIVVGLHELGHFLSARYFGVTIKQFSIGFGRSLFSITTKRGVAWHWRLWPLGGYVDMLNSRHGDVEKEQFDNCLDRKPIYQRVIIYLSGIMMNLLVAFVAFSCMNLVGFKQQTPKVAAVSSNSAAAGAGLKAGDKITHADGKACYTWREFAMGVLTHAGTKSLLSLTVKRGDKIITTSLDVAKWRLSHKNNEFLPSLGITPAKITGEKTQIIRWGLLDSITRAMSLLISTSGFFFIILKQLLVGNLPIMALLGPLGMLEATTQFFILGMSPYLNLIALFSVAVALVNLIPLPALDGGAVVYALLEKIRGKPVTVAVEMLLHNLTTIVLVVFLIHLTMNDLNRYFAN